MLCLPHLSHKTYRPLLTRSFIFVFFSIMVFGFVQVSANSHGCSKVCHMKNCESFDIHYGKYCGVGNTGCEGEEPCDKLDGCCKLHDECVSRENILSVSCHKQLHRCVTKLQREGFESFVPAESLDICNPKEACSVIVKGMEASSQLGSLFNMMSSLDSTSQPRMKTVPQRK
mmetsp:Transcript_20896/g.53957  ORF Transcript_20896/g.53957 Transcript_20896/m.53957 type:complete len:172 (-) Transcript_20896:113-628(-)